MEEAHLKIMITYPVVEKEDLIMTIDVEDKEDMIMTIDVEETEDLIMTIDVEETANGRKEAIWIKEMEEIVTANQMDIEEIETKTGDSY